MILSESEKNRIKGLYGLVTEDKTIISNALKKLNQYGLDKMIDKVGDIEDSDLIDNIIRLNPKFKKYRTQIVNGYEDIMNMSQNELNSYIKQLTNVTLKEQNFDFNDALLWLSLPLLIVAILKERSIRATKKLQKQREEQRKEMEKYRKQREEEKRIQDEKDRIEQEKRDKELEIERQKREEQRRLEYEKRAEENRKKEEERKRAEEEALRKEEEENKVFSSLKGQTVNLYNDSAEQVLYGRIQIQKLRFRPEDQIGGRSSIAIYDNDGYKYEIICLSNPDRLAPYVVEKGNYIDDFKYNRRFVNVVKQKAGNFCKKPKATFGSIDKPTDSSKIA